MTIAQAMNLALSHLHAGRLDQAALLCRQVLTADAEFPHALHWLGYILCQQGHAQDGLAMMRRACELSPQTFDYHQNLAVVLFSLGALEDSEQSCRRALQIRPEDAPACSNLGSILKARGQLKESVEWYRKAISIQPDAAPLWNNLGTALNSSGQFAAAVEAFEKALQLEPRFAQCLSNLGTALKELGRLGEAISVLRRAIELQPDLADAHHNLGVALHDAGQAQAAVDSYRQALSADADGVSGSGLLMAMQCLPAVDPSQILQGHRAWARRHEPAMARLRRPHENSRDPDRRLRIGYVSPDFREHSVTTFIEAALSHHDHAQVEVFCYSDVIRPDAVTRRLQAYADHWRSIVGLSHEQVVRIVRDDAIDILVDLAGHTAGNRLRAFAARPAPVQATWLGYLDTTGLESMDWRITDGLCDPPGMTERWHTERLLRLPRTFACYTPPADAPDVSPPPSAKAAHVTFACFARLAKVSAALLSLWQRILGCVPGSRLLIGARGLQDPWLREQFFAACSAAGIDKHRVDLLGHMPFDQWLALHVQVDIALDTWPINGHTTTCHALWMGVPVVTLAGQRYASRMGSSVLTNLGLGELSADNPEQYVQIATRLACEGDRLAVLRRTLRERISRSPLMDARGFSRDLEAGFRGIWRQWCHSST